MNMGHTSHLTPILTTTIYKVLTEILGLCFQEKKNYNFKWGIKTFIGMVHRYQNVKTLWIRPN